MSEPAPRYVKILHETKCHRGVSYQEGENKDHQPFHPYGKCKRALSIVGYYNLQLHAKLLFV